MKNDDSDGRILTASCLGWFCVGGSGVVCCLGGFCVTGTASSFTVAADAAAASLPEAASPWTLTSTEISGIDGRRLYSFHSNSSSVIIGIIGRSYLDVKLHLGCSCDCLRSSVGRTTLLNSESTSLTFTPSMCLDADRIGTLKSIVIRSLSSTREYDELTDISTFSFELPLASSLALLPSTSFESVDELLDTQLSNERSFCVARGNVAVYTSTSLDFELQREPHWALLALIHYRTMEKLSPLSCEGWWMASICDAAHTNVLIPRHFSKTSENKILLAQSRASKWPKNAFLKKKGSWNPEVPIYASRYSRSSDGGSSMTDICCRRVQENSIARESKEKIQITHISREERSNALYKAHTQLSNERSFCVARGNVAVYTSTSLDFELQREPHWALLALIHYRTMEKLSPLSCEGWWMASICDAAHTNVLIPRHFSKTSENKILLAQSRASKWPKNAFLKKKGSWNPEVPIYASRYSRSSDGGSSMTDICCRRVQENSIARESKEKIQITHISREERSNALYKAHTQLSNERSFCVARGNVAVYTSTSLDFELQREPHWALLALIHYRTMEKLSPLSCEGWWMASICDAAHTNVLIPRHFSKTSENKILLAQSRASKWPKNAFLKKKGSWNPEVPIDVLLRKAGESIKEVGNFLDSIGLIVTQVQNEQQIEEVKGRLKKLADSPQASNETASIIDALHGEDNWTRLGFVEDPSDSSLKGHVTKDLGRVIYESINFENHDSDDFVYSPCKNESKICDSLTSLLLHNLVEGANQTVEHMINFYVSIEKQLHDFEKSYLYLTRASEHLLSFIDGLQEQKIKNPEQFIRKIAKFLKNATIDLPCVNFQSYVNYAKYLVFLQGPDVPVPKNKMSFGRVLDYLESSTKWYRFLLDLDSKVLSGYEVQENITPYREVALQLIEEINEVKHKKNNNITKSWNKLVHILPRSSKDGVSLENLKMAQLEEPKLEVLKNLLSATLNHTVTNVCTTTKDGKSRKLRITGSYVKLSETMIKKECQDADFVEVFALYKVFINAPFHRENKENAHLSIIAPYWEVVRSRMIYISGEDTKYGGPSGSFLGIVRFIKNPELLHIHVIVGPAYNGRRGNVRIIGLEKPRSFIGSRENENTIKEFREILKPLKFDRSINSYKNFFRKNQVENARGLLLEKFAEFLADNKAVMDLYTVGGLIDEFQGLEDQFWELNPEISLLQAYRSLLDHITNCAKNLEDSKQLSHDHKKVLRIFCYNKRAEQLAHPGVVITKSAKTPQLKKTAWIPALIITPIPRGSYIDTSRIRH
ncbi:unnamed protein product [Trichogramma brassicae]|uniref:Uncharacterized protein n=1 Tax=Trichogramma brassicae TaxID=86971 RepID=A0A6H5INS5_9HYME|nr:unnamed protein product [Trichogramma brassicae]